MRGQTDRSVCNLTGDDEIDRLRDQRGSSGRYVIYTGRTVRRADHAMRACCENGCVICSSRTLDFFVVVVGRAVRTIDCFASWARGLRSCPPTPRPVCFLYDSKARLVCRAVVIAQASGGRDSLKKSSLCKRNLRCTTVATSVTFYSFGPPWVFACVTSGNTKEFWWHFPIPPDGGRMVRNAFIFRLVFLNEISLEPLIQIRHRFHI